MAYLDKDGYVLIGQGKRGLRKLEHVLVAEAVLGKPLPKGAVIHHLNEDKTDNRPQNLVICPDRRYHNLIHQRMDALSESGNANWLKCCRCFKYDEPSSMGKSGGRAYHHECNRRHIARYREANNGSRNL